VAELNTSASPSTGEGERFRLEQLGPPAMLPGLNRRRWSGRQRRIGLTGGIASGKSTAGRWLEQQAGLPVLDADLYARAALASGTAGEAAVLKRYGLEVQEATAGGEPPQLDRAALGRIVFHDQVERTWLEQLVHPLVGERFEAELARLAEAPVVVLMIPLLFEAGLEVLCSEVWLVDCDADQQLSRLMNRNGLSEAEARARIDSQWPLERKRTLTDVVLANRGEVSALEAALADALEPGSVRAPPVRPPRDS
jgi:dephospho-CoA kinase